ncbi:MAG: SCO7613 C-terminal domain-containing membrane protein [Acidimicrobiales bacterium]
METTTKPNGGALPRPPSTGPAAATWVAGTGAFLLLAAAAVFTAVSWDRLPEVAKLSLVGAVTGACIAGGRALRRTLPATGDVIFHLGAFLLPIDVAGLGLRASIGWRAIVVSEGVVGVGVLGALAAASGSVVLGWAATASMVVLAVGIAAVSPVPAVVALAVAAVAAHLVGDRKRALAWSSVAALGPVLGFAVATALSGTGLGSGVLAELGADGAVVALAGCLAAAVVLGREARARSDVALAGLAGAAGLSGVATTWASAGIPGDMTVLALPVVFLVAEVVAALCERDVFWRHPARAAVAVAEVAALAVGGLWTAFLLLGAPFVETGLDLMSDGPAWVPEPAAGVSLAALALGWAIAGLRRRPTAATFAGAVRAVAAPTTGVMCALAAVAAVEVGTASGPATAGALLAAAAVLLWAASPVAQVAGTALALWAPLAMAAASVSSLATLAAGTTAAAVVAMGAAVAGQTGHVVRARLLAAGAVVCAAAGTALAVVTEGGPDLSDGLALTLFVAQAWILSVAAHRTDPVGGQFGRLGMVTTAGLALALEPSAGLPAIALATALLVADTVRLRDRLAGIAAAASVQALVAMLSAQAGFDLPQTGMVLVLAAVVWSGLAAVVDDEWRAPFVAAAVFGVGAGLVLASGDQRMLSDAVIVSGGLLTAAGLVTGRSELAHAGGVAATLGIIGHLDAAGVIPLEPYVAPVALHLVVAGWHGRRSRTLSSWTAYGPAVALLGGTGLVERLNGGPAWHSLVAGAVGVLAVACGGWRRLAGPLFLGTGLLVGVTVLECLGALAGVPTWAWLAAGGSVLLGVGVALERADATPAEAGRRLVDVIVERFE